MWIRMRLDIRWRDLFAAALFCAAPRRRDGENRRAENAWGRDDCLITLSVRSSFDLLLRALRLPPGSEILMTALTVPDMVKIVRAHGLIPVPVDTDEKGHVCLQSLRRCLNDRSRMLVVAHLFGGRAELDGVLEETSYRQVLVVEDCAQSFEHVGDSGHLRSDVAMFSFGPIKTATALGGAVVKVSDPVLRGKMADLMRRDPIQSRARFVRRILRFGFLKLLTGRRSSGLFFGILNLFGRDADVFLNSLGRGFASADLLPQLRKRPSTPLLMLLCRRWRFYDYLRIDRRKNLGQYFDHLAGVHHDASHTFWVYPVFATDAHAARTRLRTAGYDATSYSRMIVVPSDDPARAAKTAADTWQAVLFLPWYPEITKEAVDEMARLLAESIRESETAPMADKIRSNR